ncbi:MAG: hypothetical protein A2751_00925 [Candidatus Doudnabacteria bacterium RIFCSPHIGHO2_01_FULL_46_14]|uniref:ATP phosphoribosyltransferase n=1 Tax=Candidatus Doudnabacteria bacterium RIFCSPHIGHO2_01_FULL_46_14 TaxID=1817824 RepID=A0A1F5NN05_9BACT|nr:MAG: hypothetical protein A2751_00925 [Candidatus Doudnabacteria bacterium RIFCSPHIGHO2_01_FULL_46_14]
MLTIALPNGTLQKAILQLFLAIGIELPKPTRQHWVRVDHDLIAQIVWMRPQHIPEMIYHGIVDLGITGLDCYYEWFYQNNPTINNREYFLRSLPSTYHPGCNLDDSLAEIRAAAEGRAKIALVGPDTEEPWGVLEKIEKGTKVLSEFPFWTKRDLLREADVVFSYGSVEAMVPKRYPYGITVVASGKSLRENRLHVIQELGISTTKLFIRPKGPNTGQAWQHVVNLLARKIIALREEYSDKDKHMNSLWSDWK